MAAAGGEILRTMAGGEILDDGGRYLPHLPSVPWSSGSDEMGLGLGGATRQRRSGSGDRHLSSPVSLYRCGS
jgi:hypothetical protein